MVRKIELKIRTWGISLAAGDASRLFSDTFPPRSLADLESPDGFLNLLRVG